MSVAERLLIARLRERDEGAFSEIVRLYGDKVFSLTYRMLGNRQEAEDVAQEVFITVFKTVDGFRGEAKFSTWLYRIAYNVFRDQARKRKELVGIDEAQWQSQADPQTADPGLRHDLMNALNSLPLHERSAIVLCCQNGLSHDEAARVLEIPLGTVKTNVLRGREKLKKILAAWGP